MNKLIPITLLLAIMLLLSACGPSPENVMDKIQAGTDLERSDYETAADYVNDVCVDLVRLMDDGFDDPSNNADRIAALKAVEQTYPYFISFGRALYQAPEDSEAEEVIKDKKVGSNLLMVAGLPERKKESLPEDWRSPMITFNRHDRKNNLSETSDHSKTGLSTDGAVPALDFSWTGGPFVYDGVKYIESPGFQRYRVTDKDDRGIDFKIGYDFIAADGSTAPVVVYRDQYSVIPLMSVETNSNDIWRFRSEPISDPAGDYIIGLEFFEDGYGNPAWNAKYYLWDIDNDKPRMTVDVYLDKID